MQFNSNGKLARYYMWLASDSEELPNDLCTYFWGLVGRTFFMVGIGGTVLGVIVYVVVHVALWMWAHKVGVSLALGIIAISVLACWILGRTKGIKIEILSEINALIKGKVKAAKGRYCPRIEWR